MKYGSYDNIAGEENYRAGQIIFKEGSSGHWVYMVLTGSIEISRAVDGKKSILGILGPGEIFGELALIGNIKRTATARALVETTLGIIDRDFLDSEFNKLSSNFRNILITIVQRYSNVINRARDFATRKDERVKKSLSLKFKDHEAFIKAYTDNASRGGLFIKTANPFEVGHRFPLELQIPGNPESLQIMCRVAWTRKQAEGTKDKPAGMGVKLSEMSKKDEQVLKKYLYSAMKK
jgi:CRP/FNR family cyclic AMP-dependent transcriptional regulator